MVRFPSNLFLGIFVFFFIPETNDRMFEEIDEMLEMEVPAMKFGGYVLCGNSAGCGRTEGGRWMLRLRTRKWRKKGLRRHEIENSVVFWR